MPARRRSYRKKRSSALGKRSFYNRLTHAVEDREWVRRSKETDPANQVEPSTIEGWNATKYGMSKRFCTPAQAQMRMMSGYTGRGAYSGRSIGRALGGMAGGFFGNKKLGGAIGAALGNAGQRYLGGGLYTGSGLYSGSGLYTSEHANNLIAGGGGGSAPGFAGSGDETGAVTISHSEYISDIYAPGTQGGGAVSFQNTPYALNPAIASTFPFLSQIAQNYDEYEFVQLIFHYRSTTTDIGNSTTGQCGTVILCTNYNAATAPFTDKQSMLEYAHAHDCKLTEHMTHGVECDPAKSAMAPCLFTRANPVVINQDLKTYDKGVFQIAIANCPVAYNGFPVGELWVDYTVTLRKPKLFVTRGLEIDRDAFYASTNVEASMNLFSSSAIVAPVLTLGPVGSYGAGLKGQQNNIGSLVQIVTGGMGVASAYKITLPATYTGPLRIIVNISVRGPGALWASTNPVGSLFFLAQTGNINSINDLYDAYGIPNAADVTCSTNTATGAVEWHLEYHVFIQMATQGIDNTLTLGPQPVVGVAAGTYNIQSAAIDISQYQTLQNANQNSNSTQFRPLYINNVGAIQIPT